MVQKRTDGICIKCKKIADVKMKDCKHKCLCTKCYLNIAENIKIDGWIKWNCLTCTPEKNLVESDEIMNKWEKNRKYTESDENISQNMVNTNRNFIIKDGEIEILHRECIEGSILEIINGDDSNDNHDIMLDMIKKYKKQMHSYLDIFEKYGDNKKVQYYIGLIYMDTFGLGNEKHNKLGVKWLTKSAMQDFSDAQNILGKIFKNGRIGIQVDKKLSHEWFMKAIKNGSLDAQMNIDYDTNFGIRGTMDSINRFNEGQIMINFFEYVKKNKDKVNSCFNCGNINKKLYRCIQCKFTTYCSKLCQKNDWVIHKNICNKCITTYK